MDEQRKDTFIEKTKNLFYKLQRVSTTDKMFFAQHLQIMIKAGIPLSKAIRTLSLQTTNKKFVQILLDIHNNLEKGQTFTMALQKYEKVFGELFINMIRSGEISGKLEEVLIQLFIQLKKRHELVSKIRNALIYPVIVICAMLGIGTAMIVFVVPKITDIFNDVNAQLPLATRLLINVSNAINKHGLVVGATIFISIVVFIKLLRTHKGKYVFDIVILQTPIIAPIIKKINLALFSRTISSLLKTDIPIVDSFKITAAIMKNSRYKKEFLEVAEEIKKGVSITEAMSHHEEILSPIVMQMISVGEETGTLDEILDEIAVFYEEEVSEIMANLPSILEPILMLVLGAAVAFMAVAIIMPMYSLTQQF